MLERKTLSLIFDKCIPNAEGSEFQVHYRSITFECTNNSNNGIIYFTIPTVFYNMDQEVSVSAIDFHTDDIHTNGEAVKPLSLHMAHTQEIEDIEAILAAKFDNVEATEIADNSFHRHPGRSTFSSTDYDKNPEEPGVIFRKGNCENILQTDSVMYLGHEAELVVTESRLATVHKNPTTEVVTAQYVEIPTKAYIKTTVDNDIRRMFNVAPKTDIKVMDSDLQTDSYPELNLMVKEIFDVLPEPNLDFIDPEAITQKNKRYQGGWWGKDDPVDKKKDNGKETVVFTQQEIYMAEHMGMDILNDEEAREDWDTYGNWYMSQGWE